MMFKFRFQYLAFLPIFFFLNPLIAADSFPSKPFRILIGFAAGGPTDLIGRIVAKEMSINLGQPVLVENKTGASSMISIREVKNSAPDGYNLLFSSIAFNVNPILIGDQAGYNPRNDFSPVSYVAKLPLVAVTAFNTSIKNIDDLIAKSKISKGNVSFGSPGNGGSAHLTGELFASLAKVSLLHVPYKGNGPALMDVIAGRVDFMFYPVFGLNEYVLGKKIQVLGVGTSKRINPFEAYPTMTELGFPGFEDTATWVGMLAPSKTPTDVIARLNSEITNGLKKPEVKAQLEKLGAIIVADTPSEFDNFLQKDYERWNKVIKDAGIKVDLNGL
jgi:tripartite-type tricarboxylate transporter receptor subunit TctC